MSVLEFLEAARVGAATTPPGPAWLADPTERHEFRWWDGERWTPAVADGGRTGDDPVDLGQEAPDWRSRWDTPARRERRAEVLMARYGATRAELAGLAAEAGLLDHPERVPARLALLRTPRDQVTGGARATQAVLLDGRNAELIARQEVVALVHCKRCRTVVALGTEPGPLHTVNYRDAAGHRFLLDDLTLSMPADVPAWTATLLAQPPRKGTRL